MAVGRWLAAVAAMVMVAGVPATADAASRAKVAVKGKAKAKRFVVVRHRTPVRAVVAVAPAASFVAAESVEPASYRWLDDADGLMQAVGDVAPDLAFVDDGQSRYAWRLADGAMVIAEPMGPEDTRFYFFDADTTAPFLVRDRLYAFGFDRGRLSEVYDVDGRATPWAAGDSRDGMAAGLYTRGRRLWFAAQTPQRMDRGQLIASRPVLIDLAVQFGRWRSDRGGDWRHGRDRDRDRDRRRDGSRWGERGRTDSVSRDGWSTGGERAGRGQRRGERDTTDVELATPLTPTPADGRAGRGRGGDRRVPVGMLPPDLAPAPVAFAPSVEPGVDAVAGREGRRSFMRADDGVGRGKPATVADAPDRADRPIPRAREEGDRSRSSREVAAVVNTVVEPTPPAAPPAPEPVAPPPAPEPTPAPAAAEPPAPTPRPSAEERRVDRVTPEGVQQD